MSSLGLPATGRSLAAPALDPAPDFDPLAHLYRWLEWITFGPWLGWCRTRFLGELIRSRRALVLGDGDGRFTARLLAANPAVTVSTVDASAAMLRLQTRRAGTHAARVERRKIDARCWRPGPSASDRRFGPPYDLIVSHFFLDCLTTGEVHALAASVRRSVSSRAVWVVSEFAISPGRMGRWLARPLIGFIYWVFGRLTGLRVRRLPNHARALGRAGFVLQKRHLWLGGLLASELWIAGRS